MFGRRSCARASQGKGTCVKSERRTDADSKVSAATRTFAEQLGAIRLLPLDGSCPVYTDPAGYPFCLCLKVSRRSFALSGESRKYPRIS